MSNRREFIVNLSLLGGGALAAGQVFAKGDAKAAAVPASAPAAGNLVLEADPQAAALSYKADTTKVDAKKFPKHLPAQNCSNCALYQGKPSEVAGGCPLFGVKKVSAKGWCSAYAKKA